MKNTLKLFGALSFVAVLCASGCSSKQPAPEAEVAAPVAEAPVLDTDMSGASTEADLGASSSGQGH